VVSLDELGGILLADSQRMRVLKAGLAGDDLDLVAAHVLADDLHLGADDLLAARDQVLDGDLGPPASAPAFARAVAVKSALLDAGQVQHGLPQRLAGDGPGVGADAAEDAVALDEGDALAELGRLDRGLLPRRPAADDEHIDVLHRVSCVTGGGI